MLGITLFAPPNVAQAKGNMKWVTKHRKELENLGKQACGDAVRFDKMIPKKKREAIVAKGKAADMKKQAVMMPPRPGGKWLVSQYKNTYTAVLDDKAGVCTTFGLAAAHILTMKKMIKDVELIAEWDKK